MAQRVNGALDALSEAMPRYPFLWGLTERWFKGDKVWVVPLTADLLKTFCFTQDVPSPYSWQVLQRFPKHRGEEALNNLGRFSRKRPDGMPLAKVLRRYPNVHMLIKFEPWVNRHRQITLYLVPQGPRGSNLRKLCDEALKDRDALRQAVKTFHAAALSHNEAVLRSVAKEKKSIDLEASLQSIRDEGKASLNRALKASGL